MLGGSDRRSGTGGAKASRSLDFTIVRPHGAGQPVAEGPGAVHLSGADNK